MNTAIVLAGGSGRRMNSDIPKQYMMLKGKPVIYYSLKAFQDNLHIDDIILVTSDHYIEYVKKNILDDTLDKVSKVIQGGVERYDSVWEGLKCIKESGYVFIHDGARPCISQKLINDCYEAVVEDGACIAAVPVKDTIKIADSEGYAAKTPDRNTLWQINKTEVNSLLKDVDVYVSLHRSEGFGLVMAEAMYLGTPVIATAWSGNTEFMNDHTACMVGYDMIELDKDYDVFKKGNVWADAHIDEAADYMVRLYEDKEYYNTKVVNGQAYAREHLGVVILFEIGRAHV